MNFIFLRFNVSNCKTIGSRAKLMNSEGVYVNFSSDSF